MKSIYSPPHTSALAPMFYLFILGRSLPLWVVAVTLAAQSVDSNALLGNVDLSYR